MVGESNQNVFFIQIDALSFAEFEISEFEISRVDCKSKLGINSKPFFYLQVTKENRYGLIHEVADAVKDSLETYG